MSTQLLGIQHAEEMGRSHMYSTPEAVGLEVRKNMLVKQTHSGGKRRGTDAKVES